MGSDHCTRNNDQYHDWSASRPARGRAVFWPNYGDLELLTDVLASTAGGAHNDLRCCRTIKFHVGASSHLKLPNQYVLTAYRIL